MLEWSLSGVLFNIVCYLVARGLDFSQWSKYINPLFFLMVYVVLSNIGDLGIFYVKQDAHFSEAYVATYQGFARSLVVVSLLLISYYWKVSGLFYAILTCSMIAIFLNGARSEFVAFTLAVFLVTLVYCLSSRLTAIIYIVVVALVVFFVYNILDYLPDSRMIELINLGDSSSGIARSHFFEYGLKIIYDFPIMGWYGKYVNIGGVGAFPHNIFSAWVNLGLIGFIAYSALFLAMGIDVLRFFESYKFNGEFKAFLFFFFYVLILIIFSKDYTHMLIGFLVGLYSRYQLALRY